MRLISDRDAKWAIEDAICDCLRGYHIPTSDNIQKALDSCPTIEAEPVKHGKWIDKGDYAICSECGGDSGTQYDGIMPIPRYSKYCPNCGAKMDEVEE